MLDAATRAARAAGQLLLAASGGEIEVEKLARRDVKLAMDRRAEEKIIGILRKDFPDHAILAEECGRLAGRSEYTWIIDPLDGTFNYYRRIPIWCTSIGLMQGEEEVLGVICDPGRDELFYAEKGKGAFLNGRTIRVSETDTIETGVIGLALGLRDAFKEKALAGAQRAALRASKVRSLGSAAMDMAYVACGRMDAYFEFGVRPWDVAAGIVLVREAGGRISTRRHPGDALDMAASNGRIHDELLKQIGW